MLFLLDFVLEQIAWFDLFCYDIAFIRIPPLKFSFVTCPYIFFSLSIFLYWKGSSIVVHFISLTSKLPYLVKETVPS